MNKTFATMVAMALVGTAGLAVSTSAEEAGVVWYFDTPDGIVKMTQEEVDSLCTAQAAGLAGEFYCNNGDHVRTALFFGHGCRAGGDYTGTMESVLHWDGDDRYFQCTYQDGSFTGANGSGSFPSLGSELRHDCWSYDQGTENSLPMPNGLGAVLTGGESETDPNGIPGGVGTWGCELLN